MERSVIRERHCHIDGLIPDYAALHPGYRRYASVALMTAGQIIQFLNLNPIPKAVISPRRSGTQRESADAPRRLRSTSCWRAANRRAGIASMLPKSGTITLARP